MDKGFVGQAARRLSGRAYAAMVRSPSPHAIADARPAQAAD
jgi:hypothetical protein